MRMLSNQVDSIKCIKGEGNPMLSEDDCLQCTSCTGEAACCRSVALRGQLAIVSSRMRLPACQGQVLGHLIAGEGSHSSLSLHMFPSGGEARGNAALWLAGQEAYPEREVRAAVNDNG